MGNFRIYSAQTQCIYDNIYTQKYGAVDLTVHLGERINTAGARQSAFKGGREWGKLLASADGENSMPAVNK